jgi:hypothetical protein
VSTTRWDCFASRADKKLRVGGACLSVGDTYSTSGVVWCSRRRGKIRWQFYHGLVGDVDEHESRASRGGSLVKCRAGLGQFKCSDHKGAGVTADADDDPGDCVGGEGRTIKSNVGLCAGREWKSYCW